jgi:hypothetical protein
VNGAHGAAASASIASFRASTSSSITMGAAARVSSPRGQLEPADRQLARSPVLQVEGLLVEEAVRRPAPAPSRRPGHVQRPGPRGSAGFASRPTHQAADEVEDADDSAPAGKLVNARLEEHDALAATRRAPWAASGL